MYIIKFILLALLLLVSMVLLKYIDFPLMIHFLIFVQFFHLQVLLIIILPVSFVIFFHPQYLIITLAKILFLLFLKLKMQIFPISYNVTSIFTNIPLQKTIDITINLIFHHNPNLNITKKKLKKLFLFATSQIYFLFNGKFYNQIDGVAMSSPLVPVLANIFMGFYEPKWLNEYNLHKPKFCFRYLDDISKTI